MRIVLIHLGFLGFSLTLLADGTWSFEMEISPDSHDLPAFIQYSLK
jgi:hypothetical protein